jgi:hypothetical protein
LVGVKFTVRPSLGLCRGEYAGDEAFAFEAAQVVGGPSTGVWLIEQIRDELDQGGIVEPSEQVSEANDGRPSPPSAGLAESQCGCVLAIDPWTAGLPR